MGINKIKDYNWVQVHNKSAGYKFVLLYIYNKIIDYIRVLFTKWWKIQPTLHRSPNKHKKRALFLYTFLL